MKMNTKPNQTKRILSMVTRGFNASMQEVEVGRFCEFKASLVYTFRLARVIL